jgi:hypothetical protein
MSQASPRSRIAPVLTVCLVLAGCADTARVTSIQKAPIATTPRTVALDQSKALSFGVAPTAVTAAAMRAGFAIGTASPRYQLALTAAVGPSRAGSYVPPGDAGVPPIWIAHPDKSLRARLTGGQILRVTAVLIEASSNREVWRGTGLLRTSDPKADAPELVDKILAKLPRS